MEANLEVVLFKDPANFFDLVLDGFSDFAMIQYCLIVQTIDFYFFANWAFFHYSFSNILDGYSEAVDGGMSKHSEPKITNYNFQSEKFSLE